MSKKSTAGARNEVKTTLAIENFRLSSHIQSTADRAAPVALSLLLEDCRKEPSTYGPETREVLGAGADGQQRRNLRDLEANISGEQKMFLGEVRLGIMWQSNVDVGNGVDLTPEEQK